MSLSTAAPGLDGLSHGPLTIPPSLAHKAPPGWVRGETREVEGSRAALSFKLSKGLAHSGATPKARIHEISGDNWVNSIVRLLFLKLLAWKLSAKLAPVG